MKRNIVIDTIIDSELIDPGSAIIIGLSGGPDSLCLLHALDSISDAYNYELVPVHVNHHLRPEADAEAEHVEEICDRMNLDCRTYDADCAAVAKELGISEEEAGRNIRYQIFDEVADELMEEGVPHEKIVIALAHNADDQCETVLFRLLRGTGPHGLAGIPVYRMSASGNTIVRPLLTVERKDIEEYIKDNKLRPNIDKSNLDNTYSRNKIRNELIPYLEKNYNPKIKEALRRYAMLADMDDVLIRKIAFSEYLESVEVDEDEKMIILDLTEIRENQPAVNSRILSYVFNLLDLESLVSFENISDLMDLIYSDHPSAGVDLPMGIRAYREYNRLVFSAGDEHIRADESLRMTPHIVMAKDFHPDEERPYAAFDFDAFDKAYPGKIGELTLRTRREGDFIPFKDGNKKIQDFFVDAKVKRNARDSVLMVCIGSEVLWILPNEFFTGERDRKKGRFSSKYHINEATDRVLFIEIAEFI